MDKKDCMINVGQHTLFGIYLMYISDNISHLTYSKTNRKLYLCIGIQF